MTKVYGSDKMSFTAHVNFNQCRYRLYLMNKDIADGKTLLFPPMVRGLVLHKVMEFIAKGWDTDPDRIIEASLKPQRTDVDFGRRLIHIYPPYGDSAVLSYPDDADHPFFRWLKDEQRAFEPAIQRYLTVRRPKAMYPEKEWERRFHDWDIVGHVDLVMDIGRPYLFAIDLKTGDRPKSNEQFLLYSWLVNGFVGKQPFGVLLWDGYELREEVLWFNIKPTNPTLMRLLWQMVEEHNTIKLAEGAINRGVHPAKVLRPNTRQFTCSERRCSFWELCPYGRRNKQGVINDEDDEPNT